MLDIVPRIGVIEAAGRIPIGDPRALHGTGRGLLGVEIVEQGLAVVVEQRVPDRPWIR